MMVTAELVRVSMSIAEAGIGLGAAFVIGFTVGLWCGWRL